MSQAPSTTPSSGSAPAQAPETGKTPGSQTQSPKGQTAQPTAAEIRKLKLTLEGKEVELPESEVIARAQKASMSDKRFMEAAALRKQAEELIAYAKSNPAEFFKKTGMNARQWAEEYLVGELKAEQMSPEQKKAAENERKLRELETEKKQRDDQAQNEAMEKLQKKHAEHYNKLFVDALTKSGLPKTQYTIKRMAELQLVNIRKKLELDADQLAKVVREDYEAEQKALLGAYDGDQLLNFLGEDMVKKLSKAQIAKLKAKGTKTVSGSQNKPKPTESQKAGLSDWRAYQMKNRGRL